MRIKRSFFFVDSIEEGIAVLLLGEGGEQRLTMPLSFLPRDVREGDWLSASFKRDDEKRRDVRDEIDRLLGNMKDNP